MKLYYGYFIIFLFVCPLFAWLPGTLDYDRAICVAQEGNWEQAEKLLSTVLVDSPDRADLLYDLGVVSYQNGELQKAVNYFCDAATNDNASDVLCEKAHFNAGNAYVECHELQKAIEQYEKVLAINPANEFAQHNLEKVKEMLKQEQEEQERQKQKEEQEQQEKSEEQQNSQSNDDANDNSSDNEESNDGQSGEQKPDDSQSNNGDQKDDPSKRENRGSPSQDCDEEKEESQQTESGANRNEGEQEGSQKNSNQGDGSDEKDEGNSDDKTNEPSQKQPQNKQQNNTENHNPTSAQQDKLKPSPDQNKHQEQKKQDIMANHEKSMDTSSQNNSNPVNPQDQWIYAILEKQAEKGKETIKKIIGAKVQKECGGKSGQNCW